MGNCAMQRVTFCAFPWQNSNVVTQCMCTKKSEDHACVKVNVLVVQCDFVSVFSLDCMFK